MEGGIYALESPMRVTLSCFMEGAAEFRLIDLTHNSVRMPEPIDQPLGCLLKSSQDKAQHTLSYKRVREGLCTWGMETGV